MKAGIKRRSSWGRRLIEKIELGEAVATPIVGMQAAWCCTFLQGRDLVLLNIVQTVPQTG